VEQDYRPSKDLKDVVAIKRGTTTSAGVGGGTTLVDSGLTQADDYWNNMAVVILSGNSNGQIRRISGFANATGTITVDTAFASQIASGTQYAIVAQHATAAAGGGDATLANQTLILGDIGDASASTLGSLYAILGNPAQAFDTMVGYEGATSLSNKLTAARAGYLDNINNSELLNISATILGRIDAAISSRSTLTQANILSDTTPFAGADISTIKGDTQTIEDSTLKASPTSGSLARFIASGGTALGTQLPDSKSLYDCLSGGVSDVNTIVGKRQVFEKTITNNANAGAVTLGTVATQSCVIESIIIHANAALPASTTCPVTGASGAVTFIDSGLAIAATLDAADKQIWWIGAVRLAAGKTIITTLSGGGANPTNITFIITYYSSSANGGTIS
jgi:hypothetical protein